MAYQLYGDGIHDDYPAIQEMLDSLTCEVALPAPKKCYVISKTLKIHGGQTLKLGETTVVKLAAYSDCAMIEDDDFSVWERNVCIDGGIWDMNNLEQTPNPSWVPDKNGQTSWDRLGVDRSNCCSVFSKLTAPINEYTGMCMRFCRIKNFTLKNLTFRNPVIYGVQLAHVEDFTVQNITFEYLTSSFKFYNMDGVHLEGNCKNGLIQNLKGTCYDDMVALTADDGCCYGPIENVVIDGLWAEHCHSAVRLLSHGEPVRNVTIKNVFGSYFKYCIGLTKYHGGEEERGVMENISIENVAACSCDGTVDMVGLQRPIVWIQKGVDVENLKISRVVREEKEGFAPLFLLEEGASAKRLQLVDIIQKNKTGRALDFIRLDGEAEITAQENLIEE